MRKPLTGLIAALALTLGVAASASAQAAPCNDTNADGSPSGFEFAQYHVSALAHEGMLGNGGHKPGEHRGFSLCLGVH
jgi:hypothetical protein